MASGRPTLAWASPVIHTAVVSRRPGSVAPEAIGRDGEPDESVAAGLNGTNSFGDRGEGTVRDASGDAWHYSWVFRALLDRNLMYREVVPDRSVLTRRG